MYDDASAADGVSGPGNDGFLTAFYGNRPKHGRQVAGEVSASAPGHWYDRD